MRNSLIASAAFAVGVGLSAGAFADPANINCTPDALHDGEGALHVVCTNGKAYGIPWTDSHAVGDVAIFNDAYKREVVSFSLVGDGVTCNVAFCGAGYPSAGPSLVSVPHIHNVTRGISPAE